jgi:hypothetical protein
VDGLIIGIAGIAMSRLAFCYSKLERHSDAVAMFESELKFLRRVSPSDHLKIGVFNFPSTCDS